MTYTRLLAACTPGTVCSEELIYTSTAAAPRYPFRVDASIPSQGATLTDVRVVRIQGQ